jgi:release factor glutamine methyltransferase
VTVLEVIQRSSEFLAKKGVDSPRLQSELLLAHVLKLPRMQLYLNFDRALSVAELESLRELIKRRSQREPLQHITGSTSFCGLELTVNRHVLIPRPETELLAEQGWNFLNGVTKQVSGKATALDFGTGSGCLAIALAVNCPAAQIAALDVSAETLQVARHNATQHKVTDRIEFFLGDGFAALPSGRRFELIVGNPPYIPTAEIDSLELEVRAHDPVVALDGGPDGLAVYRRLAIETAAFLDPAGKIMLEFGDGQEEAVREVFESQNWIVENILSDYNQRSRILIARRDS